jgi:hypothetical protein
MGSRKAPAETLMTALAANAVKTEKFDSSARRGRHGDIADRGRGKSPIIGGEVRKVDLSTPRQTNMKMFSSTK